MTHAAARLLRCPPRCVSGWLQGARSSERAREVAAEQRVRGEMESTRR